ncbi:2-oxoglutarate dehydrogenase E1 subunit family protein, partial [Sediminivirga luteola]|uniref:2-oxoglutarate dehydrogenase E1 subunit family protein n=1 Tax=Sediminivirga luteola TaxID=1774748 RepID=UPI001F57837E|nr:hypothetical protein [Sediminivirga luteola]
MEELYEQYKKDKNLVDSSWWEFFENYQPGSNGDQRNGSEARPSTAKAAKPAKTEKTAEPAKAKEPAKPRTAGSEAKKDAQQGEHSGETAKAESKATQPTPAENNP